MKGANKNCLTPKEQKFCDAYLETGNGAEAARRSYNIKNPGSVSVIVNENLNKPFIRKYLESMSEGAASRIETLSRSARNESVKLAANKDILDRAGFKPVEHSDFTTGGEKLNLYSDEQIKRAANEIINANANSNQPGTNPGDVGATSQE